VGGGRIYFSVLLWSKPDHAKVFSERENINCTIYIILLACCIIQINIKCNIEIRNASGIYLYMNFPLIVDASLINWQDSLARAVEQLFICQAQSQLQTKCSP
jgi:hypothetical protein